MASFSSADAATARRPLKARQPTAADERRQQLLQRQKEARRDFAQQARAILHNREAEAEVEPELDGMQQEREGEEEATPAAVAEGQRAGAGAAVESTVSQPSDGQLAAEFRRRRGEKRRMA